MELDKLLDPASECEKSSWSRDAFNLNKTNEHPHNPQTDDFEDIYFYYKTYETYSVSFSRTSTKQELMKSYESKKTHLREKQLKYHPDKNIGKDDTVVGMFEETTVKLQNLREAHDQFLAAGANGMSGRWYYDLKCYQVQNAWRINVKYNEQAVK